MRMYVFDRDNGEITFFDYDSEEELEEKYEEYDESPMIGGTLFLTEEEFNHIRKWKVKNNGC